MFIVPISSFSGLELESQTSVQPAQAGGVAVPFSQVFSAAIENLKETQAQSAKDAYDLAMGNIDDLAKVMINSEKASAALELTVQLTSRAVNAYKEISSMQV